MATSKLKPDLMAGATGKCAPAQDKRILAQLEHGAKAPVRAVSAPGWTIDGWTIGLFALLLFMCSVAWLLHDRTMTPASLRHGERGGTATQVSSYRAATVPAPSMAETPQAAAIINVAEAQTPTAATVAIANAASAMPGPEPVPAAQPQTAQQATRSAATARTTAPAVRAPASPASVTPPTGADTDVTLLSALIAHAGKPATVMPERSHDIVERQDGDTTVQLLARCKQLGLIEGMLCRTRICSGRWEADAACRAPSH